MKIKTKTKFSQLKSVLLYSGYQVVLTKRMKPKYENEGSKFREAKGYIVPDQLQIFINRGIGLNDRVITLIHELLHEIYPHWKETSIEREAKNMFRNLNVSQLGFLQFFVMTRAEMNAALKRLQATSPIC